MVSVSVMMTDECHYDMDIAIIDMTNLKIGWSYVITVVWMAEVCALI